MYTYVYGKAAETIYLQYRNMNRNIRDYWEMIPRTFPGLVSDSTENHINLLRKDTNLFKNDVKKKP